MEPAESLEIHNLIKLLDAASPAVRASVRRELTAKGDRLDVFLDHYRDALGPEAQFALLELIRKRTPEIPLKWPDWIDLQAPAHQLEAAFHFLADFQEEAPDYPLLGEMLDELAQGFTDELGKQALPTPSSLARHLFGEGRLVGAEEDYYHPLNSHLPHVIASGRGLPLSLCAIFILVGARFDLEINGLNLPGHFLASAEEDGEMYVFDCFNRGRTSRMREIEILSGGTRHRLDTFVDRPPGAVTIIRRVCENLVNAYDRSGRQDRCREVRELIRDIRRHGQDAHVLETASFQPGQIVRHRRYGYRGVIVEIDSHCMADETWYRANMTQPDRDQPWYHVLVDGSTATTYAAQTSLMVDVDRAEVNHPLVTLYFSEFDDGRYQRNEMPWTLPR